MSDHITNTMKKGLYYLLCALMLLAGCERPVFDSDDAVDEGKASAVVGNVQVTVAHIEQVPFAELTRLKPENVCSRLNYAVYDEEGERQAMVSQKAGDGDFGTAAFQLAEGTYTLVAVAHSSEGNPTMTDAAKIRFTNAQGFTDTFLCCDTITVGAEPLSLKLNMHRIVSMCRFVIADDIPSDVTRMRFQYRGGSGAFDASTGLGSVKSVQTVFLPAHVQPRQYDLYTFLPAEEGTLHLQVTAHDTEDYVKGEKSFDVPMRRNEITVFTGNFFSDSSTRRNTASGGVDIDADWHAERHVSY